MKIIPFFLVFFSAIFFSQTTETVKLNMNISNGMYRDYHSLKVVDLKSEELIGSIFENNQLNEISFETNAKTDIENWFKKYNKGKGDYELVMVLDRLKTARIQANDGKIIGATSFKATTFRKKEEKYYFLHKQDTLIFYKGNNLTKNVVKDIPLVLFHFIKKTYQEKPSEIYFAENQLSNFEEIYIEKLPAIQSNTIKEGVYGDYKSFFNQQPIQDIGELDYDKKGNLVKAIQEKNGKTERIPARKIYAYTDKGKIFKSIQCGYEGLETCFVEIQKGEKGFFTLNKRSNLLPAEVNNTYMTFGGALGGLSGALIGSLFDELSANNKKGKALTNENAQQFYIDPLTGNFIFDK